tara:strand:- start:58 stop:630 length:573 start_codon:yes stop_codon:yes gene_type:complete
VNFVIAAPASHPFDTYLGDMGVDNAAAGTRDYSIQLLQMLAFALCRRDPADSAELDNMYYGQHGIDELTIFQAIAQAINSGFVHGVTATADVQQNGYAIIVLIRAVLCRLRGARVVSMSSLHSLMVWLPALPSGDQHSLLAVGLAFSRQDLGGSWPRHTATRLAVGIAVAASPLSLHRTAVISHWRLPEA